MTDVSQQSFHDILQDKMNQFRTASTLRKFQISTQSDTIFVNLNYLAELSEYFHILRTGAYTEKNNERVNLDDVFMEELVVFLSYVCPDGFNFDRTINNKNILPLVYFSDRLVFPWIKQEIRKYLKSEDFNNEQYETELLIDLCYMLQTQSYPSDDIDSVYKKIALLSETKMVDKAIAEVPDNALRSLLNEKIIKFRPYTHQPRPQTFFDWDDTYSHLYM
uniref:BTB domain-containing protein n=1 Tax=Caenorhabditis tropicalis TaxID=1561998 RepID=A0A1I7U181_9PELO